MLPWTIAYALFVAVIFLVPIMMLIWRHHRSKSKQRYVPPLRRPDRSP